MLFGQVPILLIFPKNQWLLQESSNYEETHDISDLLLYWGGDERGGASGPKQDMPICVPIATQASHAVGIASALKLQKKPQAVLCTLGGWTP